MNPENKQINQTDGDKKKHAGFSVPASPFNSVKLELGLILIVGLVLLFVHDFWIRELEAQLAALAVYGVATAGWLLFRVRRILRHLPEKGSRTDE